ncbi:MAG: translational GTPase TypA, partial [Planctomycetota bacterium]
IEFFGNRGAEISEMERLGDRATLFMKVSTRGLLGARSTVLTLSRGEGVLSSVPSGYRPSGGAIETRHRGVLVASDSGQATGYSLRNLEDRGVFFVESGDKVYEGMVVGENNKDQDITVNVVRAKKMTNMRAASKDATEGIRAARKLGLEQFLEYLAADELLEVTPESLRLRKRLLREKERLRAKD